MLRQGGTRAALHTGLRPVTPHWAPWRARGDCAAARRLAPGVTRDTISHTCSALAGTAIKGLAAQTTGHWPASTVQSPVSPAG